MATMLIAFNGTRENGNFLGDQLCYLKVAHLMVQNEKPDRIIMSVSPGNEMGFLWTKFVEEYGVELVYDSWNPGDWASRWQAWDRWRVERSIEGRPFDLYRELYLRIHGAQRQQLLCGSERGIGRRNIYEYVLAGQENAPDEFPGADVYDVEIHHPPRVPARDVWISPHAKTQGNRTFTFEFWASVVRRLVDAGVSVTVGYDGAFCDDLVSNPLYQKRWGTHRQWMEGVCQHKLVACGNTGTGWLAAACGVPMVTMEPPNSQMPDHRYRECGLRNIVEVVDTPDVDYVARRITEEVNRCVVMTTGCYDVLHAGHVRHLERSRALGTKLIVALNSDESIRKLKGTVEGVQRPINPQEQRKSVLLALRCVDEVRLFDGLDATDLIRELKPDVLTNGFGYTLDKVVGRSIVEEYGGRAVITCHGDAKNEPSTTLIVRRVQAATVAEVCRAACEHSVNPFEKLKLLADHLLSVAHVPGDAADLGAYRGGSSLVMRRLAPSRRLHVFDTWEGNPYDEAGCHHGKGDWKADFNECRRVVGNSDLTVYHRGVFPATAQAADLGRFSFVYVDMDTEQATRDALDFFWPRMSPGGKVLIDDYGWHACPGVKRAVDNLPEVRCMVGFTCILEKR